MNHINAESWEYDKHIERMEAIQESEFCQGRCTDHIMGGGWNPVTISDITIIDNEIYCFHCNKKIEL